MNVERWEELKGSLKDRFDDVTERVETLDEDDGPGEQDILEFTSPMGRMRLVFTTRPLVLDKKFLGSHRIGGESTVQYKYSDTEKTHSFTIYKYDEPSDEWQEIKLESETMIF